MGGAIPPFFKHQKIIVMNRAILISIGLILFKISFSQAPWTLTKCLEYAKENNLSIKEQKFNEQIAKYDYNQSYFELLPSVNGSAQHVYNIGKRVDRYTNTFAEDRVLSQDFYVFGNLNLFNGFQSINTIKKRKLDLKASELDKEKISNDISLEIAAAYLQILYNKELSEINQAQLSTSKEQVNKTKIQVDGGKLAKRDLLDIQAQEAREEASLIRAQNSLELSYLNLTNLLEIDSVDQFKIVAPTLDMSGAGELNFSSNEVYNKALESRPEIKSAEAKIRSSELNLSISRGARMPSLSLQGYIATGYSGANKELTSYDGTGLRDNGYYVTASGERIYEPYFINPQYDPVKFNQQVDDNINKSFGFYLSIPIFNRWQTQTSINKSKVEVLKSQNRLEQTKNALNQTIKQAHTDAIASYKEYLASKKALNASSEAFKYTEQKFNLGAASSVEYNEAKNNLNRANAELIQAKYNYMFKVKIIDFYLDKSLGFE